MRSMNRTRAGLTHWVFGILSVPLLTLAGGVPSGFPGGSPLGPAKQPETGSPTQQPSVPKPIPTLQKKDAPRTRVDSILENVETGADGWVTELYIEEIGEQLTTLKEILGHPPLDRTKLLPLVAPEFRSTRLRPDERVTLRSQPPAVERYQVTPTTPSATAAQWATELEQWLGEFSEVVSKGLKATSISVEEPQPPLVKVRLRYDFAGHTTGGETLQFSGYWMTWWRQDPSQGWLLAKLALLEGWENRTTQAHFADITTCALPPGPDYDQMLRGIDWWSANLDVAAGMNVQGHNGVAVADIDGDGNEDFYVCQGSGLPNRLYRSNGDLTFTEVSREAGVDSLDRISAALFFDYDNDGDQDLLLTSKVLFLLQNDGSGHFTLLDSAEIGLRPKTKEKTIFFTTCVADFDRDSRLDIYVSSYFWEPGSVDSTVPIPYYDANNGAPNLLFRNNGDGTFADVTQETGLHVNNTRFSFACSWADYDKDGFPDLYVANDFGRNNLYHNNGDGTFADVAPQLGMEDIAPGMSVAWADYDNDGWMDLYVGNMYSTAGQRTTMQPVFKQGADDAVRSAYRRHSKGNTLFRNRGDGTFEDVSETAGVTMGRWAWSSEFLDFDLDGNEDIYVANGYVTNESTHDL